MATSHHQHHQQTFVGGNGGGGDAPPPQQQQKEFETRRALLVNDIGESLEQVLTHINALNRSLEGIIEIGNEFSSVEALWSQFETVMGRGDEDESTNQQNRTDRDDETIDESST
ncbi:uncharacterized protein PV06_00238 [Exophiala oligosperma]|uniref:DASH complex subunit DAD1 n=2 Tax=Chaetothyriales TaxID=34395 RepID=A0A0D2CCC0_9EURO|nr:uncharacterized protein PV06_00238 [Exophiala oligosperma]KAJ9647526.1 Dolichyl-diphosphooligosaccharide-protein glycosyltransferase subunit dad1 [Knufia peltigerae]KIW47547.1 hypothetical protein PV06_00238 [Exophiala oligosperma]